MRVNIKDISRRTGFSSATVSNALNRKKGVNAATAEEILKVARELGYINEARVSRVKFVIYRKNGRIIDDTPFFPALIDGVEKECKNYGLEMVICYVNRDDKDYEEQVRRLIYDESSAVILLGTELMDEDAEIYKEATCPFLMLDWWTEDMVFDGVLINNADAARTAVEYLIRKGHKEIGYLRGDYRIKAFRSREVGYNTAMSKAGLSIKPELTVTVGATSNGAYIDMMNYLEKMPKLPTAYFADNDMIALGAMKALQEKGYEVPEDVSIVGFDDLTFSEVSTPPLTTLRVPKREMGQMAVKRLIDVIKGERIKTKIQVCTIFVERESVKTLTLN